MKYISKVLSKEKELTNKEYQEYLINEIKIIEKEYYKILKLHFKYQELFSKNGLKNKVKEIRFNLRTLYEELDKKYDYKASVYNHISYTIIKTDYKYKINTYDIFSSLKIEKNPKRKVKYLYKILVTYINLYRSLDEKDYKSKDLIKYLIQYIRNEIYIEKRKIKDITSENTVVKEEIKEEIENEIEEIIVDIKNENILHNENIDDLLFSFRKVVREDKIDNSIIKIISLIINRIKNENSFEENEDLLYSVLNSLKNRKIELKKNNKNEKNILRECYKIIDTFINDINLRKSKIVEPYDYKFDMVFELLKDKNNYSIIKKLVKEYPQIVNIRNNKKSILEYILMLYINNYTNIITENKNYYSTDYIKEVYKLFCKSKSLYLSNEDINELNNILDNYILFIKDLEMGSKTKDKIINEINELYIDNINKEDKYHKPIKKEYLDEEINDTIVSDLNHINRSSEINLTSEHTFILNDPYTCYSFTEGKGIKSLKIHTVDFSNLVEENTSLDNYIYNSLLDNTKINKNIREYLKFRENDIVSAFTYEIILDDNLDIKDFKIYRSKIFIDGDILDYSNNEYVYKNLRRIVNEYISTYGDVNLVGLNKIEYILKDILQKEFIKLARKNNLPLITNKNVEKNSVSLEVYSNILKIFNKLSASEYRRLTKIFNDTIKETYYDSKVIYNEENELFLTGNINYLYLLNQRMIKVLINNEIGKNFIYYDNAKEKYNKNYTDLVNILNDLLDNKFYKAEKKNAKKYKLKRTEETNK